MNTVRLVNNYIPGRKPPGPISKTFQIAQTLELQANMRERALDPATKPIQAAACARMVKELALALLILRGIGVPAPVQPESKSRQSSRSARLSRSEPEVERVVEAVVKSGPETAKPQS